MVHCNSTVGAVMTMGLAAAVVVKGLQQRLQQRVQLQQWLQQRVQLQHQHLQKWREREYWRCR